MNAETKLLPDAPLLVLPSLATAVGLNEAIVLQQLHFRSRSLGEGGWRAKMADLRHEFPFWSEATIKRTLAGLKRDGLVEVGQAGTDRTNHYRVAYAALTKRVGQIAPVERVTSASNRSDASAQSAPVSYIGRKRNGDKREEGPRRRFSRFDQGEQRA